MAILKKKFFTIETSVLKNPLEVYATSLEDAIGRHIKMDMTRQLKGKNLEAVFEIVKKDDKVIAQIISAVVSPSYIRRIIRKSISYIEDSFLCKSQDANLRIKFFMMTRKKIHRSLRNALRLKAIEILTDICKDSNSDTIFMNIFETSLQKDLSLKLKKLYPLAFCEIRAIKVEK